MSTKKSNQKRTRVAIVGAGSAGMSAAHALALSPDQFEVELFERSPHCGGMATSTDIDPSHGASYINDGVQGELPILTARFSRCPPAWAAQPAFA